MTHPGYGAYGAGSPELANAQASSPDRPTASPRRRRPSQPSITGVNLAGKRLDPGVYNSTSDILISGPIALTLDGGGDRSSVFIFQASSSGDLTVDPTSSVTYTNGAQPCNVFWKVNSAFLKNTDDTFIGTILALTQITLTEHITVQGRVLARNADVTFIHDTINNPTCSSGGSTSTTATATTPSVTAVPSVTITSATATTPTPSTATPVPAATTPTPSGTTAAARAAAAAKVAAAKARAATEAARVAAAKKRAAAEAARVAAAKKRATPTLHAGSSTHGFARPPRRQVGFTG